MRTLVIYESMYGNTHAIADAISDGLRSAGETRVVNVANATEDFEAWADLIVVGGPTHVHGMTHERTRDAAREMAQKPDSEVTLDPSASGPGIRDWLESLVAGIGKRAAAFDTRAQGPALLTGRASAGIANVLRRRGFRLLAEPESFLIDGHSKLLAGELDRARDWGAILASELVLAS
jgi:flavodoxin-like protein